MKRLINIFTIIIVIIILAILGMAIYSSGSYEALDEMSEAIDSLEDIGVEVIEDFDQISYEVANPKANIIFIPGGLVEPDAYSYLCISLAQAGYDVTISKAFFNLAILTPNYASRFLVEDMDNYIIGHSLGGVVGSMVASKSELVDKVVLLGSYPIKDLSDKEVLFITAEHDDGMNPEEFDESLKYVSEENIYLIEGGNHAQFGWYGEQKGDGTAEITTGEQQLITIEKILEFIGS